MLPDAPEEETERDGVLSSSTEWHSFTHGLYDSMRTAKPYTRKLPDVRDVQKEPHYYKGAYVIGTILHLILLAVFVGLIR